MLSVTFVGPQQSQMCTIWFGGAEEEPKIEAILVCRKFIVGDICSYSSESCCYEHSCSNCGRPGHPATEYKGDPKERGKT